MRLWKRAVNVDDEKLEEYELRYPERVVSREYYGAILGIQFDSDAQAARHYLSDGWRTGVVPHPFLDAAMARSSMDAAVKLRDSLRLLGSGNHVSDLGGVTRFLDIEALNAGGKAGLAEDAALLLEASVDERDALRVNRGATWGETRAMLAASIAASQRVAESNLLDLAHYGPQRPRPFLSWYAAWDDYVVEGEDAGATPNWIFEPEWHATNDGAQRRTTRPLNQLLAYVLGGESSTVSPLDSLVGSGHRSSLTWMLSESSALVEIEGTSLTLASIRHDEETELTRVSVSPSMPRRVPLRGGENIDIAVIVDARHIVTAEHIRDLVHLARTQNVAFRSIYVICATTDDHEPPLGVELDDLERVTVVHGRVGETLGAMASELVQGGGFAAWTLWRPGQVWKPDGLIATGRALDAYPESAAIGAFTPFAPQDWNDPQASLWASRLDAAGIVFRTARIAPDPLRDYGLNAEAVIQLGLHGDGLILDGDRFWARKYDPSTFANRAGANVARSRHAVFDFEAPSADASATVVMPTFEDWRMTFDAVSAIRATSDANVIIVDNGSRRAVGSILRRAFLRDARVGYLRLPRNADFAAGSNIGARFAQTARIVFVNNDTLVLEGWLAPLLDALDSAAAAQPLLLFADGTVQTAGTVFAGGLSTPRHLLSGFAVADVPGQVGTYNFSALTAACLAVSRDAFESVNGFDAEYVNGMEDVDLTLRLKKSTGRPLRVVPTARVRHLESKTPGRFGYSRPNRVRLSNFWRDELLHDLDDRAVLDGSQLRVVGIRWGDQRGFALREPEWIIERRQTSVVTTERPVRLRWSLKISSPGTLLGDRWGDTYFADDLAGALRALDQEVVVDRVSAWDRPGTGDLDEVNLALRGLHRFTPAPHMVNLLWVISHPDQVSADELASGWDHVYAAGPRWVAERKDTHRIPIDVLLQATHDGRFTPASGDANRAGVLFVGRTRGQRRMVVLDAARASNDLRVYGDDGWEEYLDREMIHGDLLRNDELPAAYSRARVVLNDHWEDMRRGGFLSNRLFDAAATGARIVSDQIDGLHDVFGSQVQTYGNEGELRELLSAESTAWPTTEELTALAKVVGESHSFNTRARVLLDSALRARASASSRR